MTNIYALHLKSIFAIRFTLHLDTLHSDLNLETNVHFDKLSKTKFFQLKVVTFLLSYFCSIYSIY